MADRSVPMTLSALERQNVVVKFFRLISLITLVPCRTTEFGIDNTWDRRITGQPRTYRKGAVPQRSPILGIFVYLCLHIF